MIGNSRLGWAAAALILAAAGCTDAGASFFIVQNQSPDQGCVVPSSTTANFIPRGRIEVEAESGYLFTPVVQSLVRQSPTGQSPRVLFVEGADVTLSFDEARISASEQASLRDSGLAHFRQAFSGAIYPGGVTSFAFEVISRALLDRLGGMVGAGDSILVTAEVVLFGSLDGGTIESQPFTYPIDVCRGCLLVDRGLCAGLPAGYEPATGGNCQTLQDMPLDCCTSAEGDLVCPAVAGL
jgi:hypothetical protein